MKKDMENKAVINKETKEFKQKDKSLIEVVLKENTNINGITYLKGEKIEVPYEIYEQLKSFN